MPDRARDHARARHPSASWVADHERLRRLLAGRLAEEGHPRPLLAATVLGVRGLLGLDRGAFATVIGTDLGRLSELEGGPAQAIRGSDAEPGELS